MKPIGQGLCVVLMLTVPVLAEIVDRVSVVVGTRAISKAISIATFEW